MKTAFRHAAFVSLFLLSSSAFAGEAPSGEHRFLGYERFTPRLALGMTLGPETFAIAGSFEYNADRFFSFGPMLLGGLGSSDDLVIGSLIGRLTAPIYAWERVEFSIFTGPGFIYREAGGLTFRDFAYGVGFNADVFIIPHLTAGLGMSLYVTGAETERTLGTLTASATYRF